tara:strand:- start:10 stop:249 length:240 start_codon:yes stop_codon:yes gene_type:complete
VYGAITRYGRPSQSITLSLHGPEAALHLTQTYLDLYARRQIQLHERINGLFRRLYNVEQSFMRSDLVLVARIFIDVRRY